MAESPATHVIEAGTDGAMLCAFDAALLPPDFDEAAADDPVGMLERLQADGRLWFTETGGDGSFRVAVTVGTGDAPVMRGRRVHRGEIVVQSGSLWVCGAEYVARDPALGSATTPKGGLDRNRMGGAVAVPPGRYRLEVLCPSPRPDHHASPGGSWQSQALMVMLVLGALIGLLGLVGTVVQLSGKLYRWFGGVPLDMGGWNGVLVLTVMLAGGIALVLSALWLGRLLEDPKEPAEPDYVLRLKPAKPSRGQEQRSRPPLTGT